jgi:ankyrin repeat protein
MGEQNPSEFYFACRNNDINTVRRLLDEHSLEDLDQMEPNGSTGLHAACFYKNIEIIQLLLERGFSRCVINKFNNMPADESETDEIRELFKRPKTSNRFGGHIPYEREKLLWIFIDGHDQHVIQYRTSDTYDGKRLEYGLFNGDKILQQLCNNMPKIDVIRRLFNRAIKEKDCTRLLQAFTAETDFYNRINNYLISCNEQMINNGSVQPNITSEFIDTIRLNQQLHKNYQFEGTCYRSIKIKSHNELNNYKVGAKLINRTFLSTTKDRQLAEEYVRDNEDGQENTVIISFKIRYSKTALDMEYISEYPHEKEILIMNNTIFKVIHVTTKPNLDVEIELRESKSI